MAKAEYLRALPGRSAIFGTSDGPGGFIENGNTILLSKVNKGYAEMVRNGGRSEDVEIVELEDDTHEETGEEINKGVDEPGESNSGLYDPTEHNVAEVMEYLKTASPEEVQRVKEAEAAGGRQGGPSKTIAAFKPEGSE